MRQDRYATYKDLDINDKDEDIVLGQDEASDDDINKDFFQMEEREI